MQSPGSNVNSGCLIILETRDLPIGMLVYALDCPCSVTPLLMGGFYVKKVGDIQIIHSPG